MESFFNFLKFVGVLVAVVIVIFLILLALPKSRLRESILKIFSYISYALSVLGILYVASPIDLVPDLVPIAGQADDLVALSSAILTALSGYLSWQKSKRAARHDGDRPDRAVKDRS